MEVKRLGDYVKVVTGKLDANASNNDGIYPFFTCSITNLRINTFAYDCECVLVAGNGDLNVKYYKGKFNAYQRTYIIESMDKEVLDVRFLYYFMNKYISVLRNNSIGGVIKYIKLGDLTETQIPLTPIQTQKKIVEVLDKAQELIDARKQQIKLLDDLIQSVFYDMFGDPVMNPKGWKEDLFQSCIFKIDSGWSPKCYSNEAPTNKWGVLKLSAVTGGKYRYGQNKELPEDVEPKAQCEVKKGDLLLTRKNTLELVGDCCYVFETPEKLLLPDIIFRINVTPLVNKIFLWKLFSNEIFKTTITSLASGSAASMPNISKAKLKNLKIVLPPIDLQNQFAQIVRQIENQKQLMQQSLTEMENNFNNLMQRAFKGELFS